jgi:plasmid stabilization system protein ParE
LKQIHDYIARDSQVIAAAFIEKVLDSIDRLADFPFLGPRIREWKRTPYRHLIVPPYRVIYRVDPKRDAVILVAIVHGARDLKKFFRGSPRR